MGIVESPTWAINYLERINSTQCYHRNYIEVTKRLSANTLVRKPGEVIRIIGPSRVGKTTILEELIKNENADSLNTRSAVYVEMQNNGPNSEVSSKDFSIECIDAIKHPIFSVDAYNHDLNEDYYRIVQKTPERTYWKAFINDLKLYRTRFVIFDELQNLLHCKDGVFAAGRFVDSCKSKIKKANAVLIMCGGYGLLEIFGLSPHMLGRENTIHYARYHIDSKEDVKEFLGVLKWYSQGVKFKRDKDDFSKWARELFEYSLGCVGLLDAIVRDAIAEMISSGDENLSILHIEQAVKSNRDRESIEEEILDGEDYLDINNEGRKKISIVVNKSPSDNKNKITKKSVPFRRKPARYKKESFL